MFKLFELLKDPNANYRDPNIEPQYIKIRKLPISFDLNTLVQPKKTPGDILLETSKQVSH
jgi:hypothetical protein